MLQFLGGDTFLKVSRHDHLHNMIHRIMPVVQMLIIKDYFVLALNPALLLNPPFLKLYT